jgi:homoserine kinase
MIRYRGEGAAILTQQGIAESVVLAAMQFTARREGVGLPAVRLGVHNEIPPGAGLGGSAAANVAGISLCAALAGREMPLARVLQYAAELEGHADNAAATLYGGLNVSCRSDSGEVVALRHAWPDDLRVVAVTPHVKLPTRRARAVLPQLIAHRDAVQNIQRATLFLGALQSRRYDLLWEATHDCLHQPFRQDLIPGLADALATPRLPGLVGLALSGAGPTVAALATDNFSNIGARVAASFQRVGIGVTIRVLRCEVLGRSIEISASRTTGHFKQVSAP